MTDIIRTTRRFGEYYTRVEPFRESDPQAWECRVQDGRQLQARIKSSSPRPQEAKPADPSAPLGRVGGTGNVLTLRRKRHG